jgi:hypothetical protein
VKSIRLLRCAENSAQRTGEAQPLTAASFGVGFVRRELLDDGHVIWVHHRRSLERRE